MANTPQHSFFSTQDVVSPDIDVYYSKIIQEIDAFRSRFNGTTTNLSRTISLQALDTVFANNDANALSPQESRCHAFYRMVGFPVMSGDGENLYSPGFDPDLNRDQNKIQTNLKVAQSALNKWEPILTERENYAKNSINAFRNKDDSASVTAIAAIFPRAFDSQFKKGQSPLDIDKQTFEIPARQTLNLNFPDLSSIISKIINSKHILKPFIVDPRVDFTVTPAANRICAPFLLNKSKTQLSQGTYLKRPYIEKVIRVRFNNLNILKNDKEEANAYVLELLEFIKGATELTDDSLVSSISNSLSSLHKSELMVIDKFLQIIRALILTLVDSIIQIDRIRSKINWKPIPNVKGPEFGSQINEVNINDTANNQKIENDISELEIQKTLRNTDFNIGINNPDPANFAFSGIDDVVLETTKHNTEFYDKQLSKLNNQRNELGRQANDLLRKIEIITGEFSGLGLLDIMAIQAALWSISPGALIGLIDQDAFERMTSFEELKTNVERLSPQASLADFEKKISEIYVFMGSVYDNIIKSDKKNQ